MRYSRRVPSRRSVTRPASFSTRRCCDTAGRLTGRSRAMSPTGRGPWRRRSKTARRVGSASAANPSPLAFTYRKRTLTCRRCQGVAADYTSRPRNRPVPPFVMDRPILSAFVRELLEHDRLHAFAEALPARARVSEPALPLVVAALHERLARPLAVLVPEDADARDLAEAAAWFIGEERVALLPSRGVRWDSGLEPPPHLVGERARALDGLAAGARPGRPVRDRARPPRLRLARARARPAPRHAGLPPPGTAHRCSRRPRAPVLRRPP